MLASNPDGQKTLERISPGVTLSKMLFAILDQGQQLGSKPRSRDRHLRICLQVFDVEETTGGFMDLETEFIPGRSIKLRRENPMSAVSSSH
jgi:hypothetical protein